MDNHFLHNASVQLLEFARAAGGADPESTPAAVGVSLVGLSLGVVLILRGFGII